jgi:hypothetical protein
VPEYDFGEGFASASFEDQKAAFHWLHVPASQSVQVVLSRYPPIWYWGHWTSGRMHPCQTEGCPFCQREIGRQRRWVFAVWSITAKAPMLWETSDATADAISALADHYDALLNLRISIERSNAGPRGRLSLDCNGKDILTRGEDPAIPDPKEAILATWSGLSQRFSDEGSREY